MKIIIIVLLSAMTSHAAVTWEKQAERLQKISVSFLEAIPVSTPINSNTFDLYAEISILPRPNSTVGSKNEDTKTPPAHMVPSLRYNRKLYDKLAARVWFGILPPFLAGLISEHDIIQVLGGVEGQILLPRSFYIPFGYQLTYANIKGHITTKDSQDDLETMAGIMYAGLGQSFDRWFYSTTVGGRRNDSEFYIGEDETELKFSDQSEENRLPFFYQGNLGVNYKKFTFVGSQLYIPNRVLMSKLTIMYSW